MADLAHPSWIALAAEGPVAELAEILPPGRLRVVRDPAVFDALLCAGRPHLAILAEPLARPEDVLLAVRERRRRSTLRLLHLSDPEAVAGRLEALRLGFDEALPDTISADELMARMELLEERAQTRNGAGVLVADGVILDPVAHEVRRDGELIHLRPKEYQLLAMLAAHPGRTYTRRQLLDRVWGHDHDGDPRTVDVHVRWLRSKIEPQPDAPVHLVTVRGVGYRLDPMPR
ncbi:MAG: winged helix-turn-helix domain-containing protein [Candidatus Limnocylindrales bacterium]